MFNLKRHIALLFVLVLLVPLIVQTIHAINDNHEHIVCKSINEQHIHKQDLDCSELHFPLKTLALNLTFCNKVTTKQFYKSNFNRQSQIFLAVYNSYKSSRGPPELA